MRRESFPQYAIVQGATAQMLTEELNTKLFELRHKHPRVEFQGLIAQISYTETLEEFECVADEYEAEGIRLTCQDCPAFQPIRKANGTEDLRVKWGDCPHANMGRTSRDARACNKLFQMINSGEVRLCLANER